MIAARRLAAIVAANVPECLFWVISGGAGPPAAWQVNLNKRTPNSSALTWRSVTRRPDDNVLDLLS